MTYEFSGAGTDIKYRQTGSGILPNYAVNFTTSASRGGVVDTSGTGASNFMNDGTHDWSLNLWYRYPGYVNGSQPIIDVFGSYSGGLDSNPFVRIYKGSTPDLFCGEIINAAGNSPIGGCTGQHIANDPSWHMITMTFHHTGHSASDTMVFFVDGLQTNSVFGNGAFGYSSGSDKLAIANKWCSIGGAFCAASEWDKALVTQISLWSRVLNTTEVSNLWNSGAGLGLLPQSAAIAINPASGSKGIVVQITGTGFHQSDTIIMLFDRLNLKNFTSSATGAFSGNFTVPSNATIGTHAITASDTHTGQATTSFYVFSNLILNPVAGPTYTNVVMKATGFTPNKSVSVTYDGLPITATPSIVTDHLGQFNGTVINIPASAIGANTVKACDTSSVCQSAIFTVTGAIITNFASGNQVGNLTSITPIITSNTPMLALSQSLYFNNGTLIQTITYASPITVNANIPLQLTTFTYTVITSSTFYEIVTTTDAYNTYTPKSQTITFFPVIGFNPVNITIGQQNYSATNTNTIPIMYTRQDINSSTTQLLLAYPPNFNMTCNLNFQLSQLNKTFIKIPFTTLTNGQHQSTFTFKNVNNDIILTNCTDVTSHASALYVLTQGNFPLQQQIQQFRSGQFGTKGLFGIIDVISLIGVLLAMIGLSRVNEAAGIVIAIIMIGLLAFFQVITFPTIVTGAIAVIVMIAVVSTKKLPWSQ